MHVVVCLLCMKCIINAIVSRLSPANVGALFQEATSVTIIPLHSKVKSSRYFTHNSNFYTRALKPNADIYFNPTLTSFWRFIFIQNRGYLLKITILYVNKKNLHNKQQEQSNKIPSKWCYTDLFKNLEPTVHCAQHKMIAKTNTKRESNVCCFSSVTRPGFASDDCRLHAVVRLVLLA